MRRTTTMAAQAAVLLTVLALACTAGVRKGDGAMTSSASRSGWNFHNVADNTVRDRLWVWAHEAGVYNGNWGLPGTMRITPIEGALYLGVPNIIFIRYQDLPPVENDLQYYIPFRCMKRVVWSLTGGSGVTSRAEQEMALRLAGENHNLVGFFMDDFFHAGGMASTVWLAQNNPDFPVTLRLRLPEATTVAAVALEQTDWHSGDYRSSDFEILQRADDGSWHEVARGVLPDEAGALVRVPLDGSYLASEFEIRILGTHDKSDAFSCGLRRVRFFDAAGREVPMEDAEVEADSVYPGHPPECVLTDEAVGGEAGSMSVEAVRRFRERCVIDGVQRELGVTLYTGQWGDELKPYLDLIDTIGLWTWKAEDLSDLEENLARAEQLAPHCRVWLGCYLWDFGNGWPIPLEAMRLQCERGLQWLEAGRIEGMIFLGTNVCDLQLEAVEWTRQWIQEVGDRPLSAR